jgi:sterol desaturase/sphingolipid hydroxylase (fatty acid hydroxylase superfamily)
MKPPRALWKAMGALAGFALLTALEYRRPLRRRVEPKPRRLLRNVAISALSAAVVQLAATPVLRPLTRTVERRRWGLLQRLPLPPRLQWLRVPLGLLLLDYTLYHWHVLLHRAPGLWRFHAVHHVDLDLDASTALRFHFGELIPAIGWNALEVAVLGIDSRTFALRQRILAASVLFHHSDLRLPVALERALCQIFVTPRMHGIHHSIVQEETDSNWSSGLSLWDRLHGTLRLDVPQGEIVIGVPAWQDPADVTLPRIVAQPFRPQPESWTLPDGTRPAPHPATAPRPIAD